MFKCLQVSQAHGGLEDQGGVQAQRQHPQRQEEMGLHKRADREGEGSLLQGTNRLYPDQGGGWSRIWGARASLVTVINT